MAADQSNSDVQVADAIQQAARAHERDRYLTALLAPKAARQPLIQLAAFQGEIARIPLVVTEPMIGEIRLQWWRDTFDNANAGVLSGNPIADAVTRTMRSQGLARGLFTAMIDAQSLALYPEPPQDEMAFQQHLMKFEGTAFELAARLVKGAALSGDESQFCRDAGVAYGLARTATEFAAVAAQGRTLLPSDWLRDANLSVADLSVAHRDMDWQALLTRLCDSAEDRMAKLRQHRGLSFAVKSACRPLATVSSYVARVRSVGRAAVQNSVEILPISRVWRIWRGF